MKYWKIVLVDFYGLNKENKPGHVAQWVMCLTADPGVSKVDPGLPYICGDESLNDFLVILLPMADSRKVVVSYKRKYVLKVLV